MTRLEDPDLLTGRARFMADLPLDDGTLHAAFVRSPMAHAAISGVRTEEARRVPGVVSVETNETLGLGPFVLFPGSEAHTQPPLATDRVRHVGAPVCLIVATSEAAAVDAAELVDVGYDPLPVLTVPPAPDHQPIRLYDDADNLVGELEAEGDDPVSGADVIVEAGIYNQRVGSAPMECDGILAIPRVDSLDVWCTSQGVQELRKQLATALGVEVNALRVRSPAVGGGFGGRGSATPEMVAVCAAATRLGRSIRWIQSRYENLTNMPQGRGYLSQVRLGVDTDGHITGLDISIDADAGSSAHMASLLLVSARRQVPGMYEVPAYRFESRTWLSNSAPVGAYRGAGQPEANHARERILDITARRLGIDPVEIRRRNLARSFPFTTAGGFAYDAADPLRALDRAVELIGWDDRRAEQERRRERRDSVELGLGVSVYAQTSGRGGPIDSVEVVVGDDGAATVHCASPDHGQGHLTTWAGIVADQLGIAPNLVTMVDADTAVIDEGQSTGGSRSTQVVASALVNACGDIVDAARVAAADELEAAPGDLVVVPAGHGQEAGLAVAGVPTRRVPWSALAQRSQGGCLDAARREAVEDAAYPYGCHATVVEVDTETGEVRLVEHVSVDDCGRVLQPILVEGQQHGGAVAGLSQALFEHAAYDNDGNAVAATFGTYLLPAATEICPIMTDTLDIPALGNQLGTRGIGENGCNGATAAAHNAVIDALAERGVEHIDLPLTPERVWEAVAGR